MSATFPPCCVAEIDYSVVESLLPLSKILLKCTLHTLLMPDLSEKPLDVYCYSVPLLKVLIQVWRGTKQHKQTKTKPGHNLLHVNQTCISTFLEQYVYCQQLLLSFRGVLNITVAQYFKKHRLRFKKKKSGERGKGGSRF